MRDIPKFDSREIGQNLRSLMKQHDMTVKDLQKILGLSCPQTIYHWLNGDSVPTSDQRDRYSGRISVPDGTLTFLIALPPFQGHKINQYIFLQYFNVLLTAFDYF